MVHRIVALSACCLFAVAEARAADDPAFPVRPLRLVVGFPAGGPVDLQARVIGQRLADVLGQPVVIDNRPGADGTLAADLVARAPADGHTMSLATAGLTINETLNRGRLAYDLARDFAPVMRVTSSSYALVVNPSLPAATVREFVALARAKQGQLAYASSGNGSTTHLAAALLATMAGIELVHVPYKGGAPSLTAVMANEVHMTFVGLPPTLPHLRSGKARALAVSGAKRAASLPDVPAVAETFPGYDVQGWYGVLVPARTPTAVVDRLHAAMARVLETAAVREKLAGLGVEPVGNTPQAFAGEIRAEIVRWRDVVRRTGMKVD